MLRSLDQRVLRPPSLNRAILALRQFLGLSRYPSRYPQGVTCLLAFFFEAGKTWLSVKYKTTYDHTIGHINVATGEFEGDLKLNEELAVAKLACPTDQTAPRYRPR